MAGDTVVVGADQEDSCSSSVVNGASGYPTDRGCAAAGQADHASGAAYVFVRTGQSWSAQAYLKGNANAKGFGCSIALSGETLAVGAYQTEQAGAVFVYTRTAQSWSFQAVLKAENARSGDYFGYSVSLSGDTLVVGAFREDGSGQCGERGERIRWSRLRCILVRGRVRVHAQQPELERAGIPQGGERGHKRRFWSLRGGVGRLGAGWRQRRRQL